MIVAIMVSALFLASPNAYVIWPIGMVILLLLLGTIRVGHFYKTYLIMGRPFLFKKIKLTAGK